MRRRHLVTLAALGAAALVASGFVHRGPSERPRLFAEVLERISATQVEALDQEQLYERAARGLVDQLDDPYADLFSPEQLATFARDRLGSSYGGLGMLIEPLGDEVRVLRVFSGTPAETAGIAAGDRLLRVDSVAVTGRPLDETARRLRGPVGSSVSVTIQRDGAARPMELQLHRALVHSPAVRQAMALSPDVGYVALQVFSGTAADELTEAVRGLLDNGARAVVLDLRGNPGGDLDEAVEVSSLFLPRGSVVARVRHRGRSEERHVAVGRPITERAPLVILVDGFSASASEIVAGALQDHDRALIVGTRSFGKGLVQTISMLSGGWALKLTTGRWHTPSGRSIHRDRRAEGDSIPAARSAWDPVFHTDAGREVRGGGGIMPDVVVAGDSGTSAQRAALSALAPQAQRVQTAIAAVALELRTGVRADFRVTPAWRAMLMRRLGQEGVVADAATLEAAGPTLDRLLEERVARLAFGDTAAFRRRARDDEALTRAVDLLRDARSQRELIALAGGSRNPS